MKHTNRTTPAPLAMLLAAWLLAAAVTPAAAQRPDDAEHWHPGWGDWSLSFDLPTGGGSGLGFWRQAGPNVAFGLTTEASFARVEREQPGGTLATNQIRLALGPALKRYWWQEGPVSPFLRVAAEGVYQRTTAGDLGTWRMGGGLSLGLGAEWFPTRGIGIGGHTGLGASYFWTTDDDDLPSDEVRLRMDLFTSALSIQVYF